MTIMRRAPRICIPSPGWAVLCDFSVELDVPLPVVTGHHQGIGVLQVKAERGPAQTGFERLYLTLEFDGRQYGSSQFSTSRMRSSGVKLGACSLEDRTSRFVQS